MKPKFFSHISDHQQGKVRSLREALLIPPALLVVADFCFRLMALKVSGVRFQVSVWKKRELV
jgi:hypothetical protein